MHMYMHIKNIYIYVHARVYKCRIKVRYIMTYAYNNQLYVLVLNKRCF